VWAVLSSNSCICHLSHLLRTSLSPHTGENNATQACIAESSGVVFDRPSAKCRQQQATSPRFTGEMDFGGRHTSIRQGLPSN
jgi:hypothetical protein